MVKDAPQDTGAHTQHISLQEKNAMKNVGFIGWRGMVGSVLMQRMVEE
ncbi:aspartate-semialdehyde dehydrogenase, partial [Salmonella enterica subsp. enterica serovar Newport]